MTRGRFFTRLFYLTSGTAGAASLCYPHEAREIANVAYEEGQKISLIAYHFAIGGTDNHFLHHYSDNLEKTFH
jgi:hypothetical protein